MTRTPSTSTRALGPTRVPSSRTIRPSTRTRPSRMNSSAARREARPARASTFCNRSSLTRTRYHSTLASAHPCVGHASVFGGGRGPRLRRFEGLRRLGLAPLLLGKLAERDLVAVPAIDVAVEIDVHAHALQLAFVVHLPHVRLSVAIGVAL